MNTMSDFDRRAAAWLADGPSELNDRVLDAALHEVHLTHQRRALRVSWRFPLMPALTRATSLAAVALVAVIGVGGLIYVNSTGLGGPSASSTPSPTGTPVDPTTTPARPTATPAPSGWATLTSTIYPRLDVAYPVSWSVSTPATRAWQVGDAFPADDLSYADIVVSPGDGDTQIGLFVWEMPSAGGAPDSFALLKSWAETFCNDVLAPSTSCESFTQNAVPMCHLLGDGCDAGDGAILVSTADAQYVFFRTWQYDLFDSTTVRAVVLTRADDFPPAAPYGGSVALLKSILTHMNIWTLGEEPAS